MALPTGVERRRNSRDALLTATAALLTERSSLDASLSDIALRSGLNSALIEYYFEGKEGLFMAVLERDTEKSMASLANLIRMPYINRLISYIVVQGSEKSSRRSAQIFVEPLLEAYRSIVSQGMEEGTFRPIDPNMLYYSVIGACEHIFYASYSIPTAFGVSRLTGQAKQLYSQRVIDLCLGGIRRDPELGA